ncbi:MAG: type III secretion system chaperone [Gammaproteobacteria bacterium]|nr:type III secretion system chaperone [Gammaproteobacteria bacterium]
MPAQGPTSPRQRFLELFRGLRSGSSISKDDPNAPCDASCKFNDIQFVARHPDPESEQFALEVPLGKLPESNATSKLEKLLVMNLGLLRQFGPSIGLAKDATVVFRSRDSLTTVNTASLKLALEALSRIRKDFASAMAKKPGASA